MNCQRRFGFCAAVLVFAFSVTVIADEIDVQALIKDLNADKFAVRRAATQKLQEMGKAAFGALSKAAESSDGEVTNRSVEILKHHFENGDEATKTEAKAALEKLAAAAHPVAARLAQQALKPKDEHPNGIPGIPGGIQIGGGQIQIQVQAVGGGGVNRKVRVQVANGAKQIEVEEDGQKVKINEDANGIKMEVTEKKDGKEETKKYEAKNADELKKQHPAVHQIYEKYSKGQGGIQFQIQGAQILPQGVPGILPVLPPNQNNGRDQFERSKQNLEQIIERYKKQIEQNGGNADALKQAIEALEKHKQHIDEIQKRFEKQHEEADATRKQLEEQREEIRKALEKSKENPAA